MKNREENKFREFNGLDGVIDNHIAEFITIPKATVLITEIKSRLQDVRLEEEAQSSATEGRIDQRDYWQDKVITSTLAAKGALYLLGSELNDEEMKAVAESVTLSDIRYGHIEDRFNNAQKIQKRVQPVLLQLLDHGYTEAMYLELGTNMDGFERSIKRVSSGLAEQKSATQSIPELLDEIEEKFIKMDNYIHIMAPAHEQLAKDYWNAREVKDLGVRHEPEEEPVTPPVA